MENTSRRSFIKGSMAGAVAVASGSFASAAVAQQPKTWDETVDVIVIGSGFAGLAAAIEAKKAGANVVVLEKMPTAGGNSIINGGILTATGCPQQKMHKIQDSKELLEKDILVAGNYMNDPKKVRQMVDRVLSNYEWTVNELGVEYLPDAIGQEGGHSVPRYVTTKIGSGAKNLVSPSAQELMWTASFVRLRGFRASKCSRATASRKRAAENRSQLRPIRALSFATAASPRTFPTEQSRIRN